MTTENNSEPDNSVTPIDLGTISDEDFLKLLNNDNYDEIPDMLSFNKQSLEEHKAIQISGKVHKAIAYCLTDVQTDSMRPWVITDSRINPDAELLNLLAANAIRENNKIGYYFNKDFREIAATYIDYVETGGSSLLHDRQNSMQDTYHMDYLLQSAYRIVPHLAFHLGEYGLPNVLAIIPVSEAEDFYRESDDIDFVEQLLKENPFEPTIKMLPRDIRYNSGFMDKDTHELLPYHSASKLHHLLAELRAAGVPENILQNPIDLSKEAPLEARLLQECSDAMLYSSYLTAEQQAVPAVPDDIINLADWAGIFTDIATVWSLRPALITWIE